MKTSSIRDPFEVCPDCRWRYPDELLSPFFNYKTGLQYICGICALARTNEIHGTQLQAFHGEQAEEQRQAAIAWRGSHGGGPSRGAEEA